MALAWFSAKNIPAGKQELKYESMMQQAQVGKTESAYGSLQTYKKKGTY